MCGRYVLTDHGVVWKRYGVEDDWFETRIRPGVPRDLQPRFNIAPSQGILTIRQTKQGREPEIARWGFQPAWMQVGRIPPPINAKAETLMEKPMWKGSLRRGRVLVPADGFFEWRKVPGQKAKQPMLIRLKGGGLFSFAGLSTLDADQDPTAAIITTAPNELVASIHDRMPVILPEDAEADWLDPDLPIDVALQLLMAYPADEMESYPVSRDVGDVHNQGAYLAEPLNDGED